MPALTGFVDEEQDETIDELVERRKYEDRSEFLNDAVSYYLYHKH